MEYTTNKINIEKRNIVARYCNDRWETGLTCEGCKFNRSNGYYEESKCSQEDVIDGILRCDVIIKFDWNKISTFKGSSNRQGKCSRRAFDDKEKEKIYVPAFIEKHARNVGEEYKQ